MTNKHKFIGGHCRICGKDRDTHAKDGAPCGPTPFTGIIRPDDVRPTERCAYWSCEKCGQKIELSPGPLPKDQQLRIWCPHCDHLDNYWLRDLR